MFRDLLTICLLCFLAAVNLNSQSLKLELSAIGGYEQYNSFSAYTFDKGSSLRQYSFLARIRPSFNIIDSLRFKADYTIEQNGFEGLYYYSRYVRTYDNFLNHDNQISNKLFHSIDELSLKYKTGNLGIEAGRMNINPLLGRNFTALEIGKKSGFLDPRGLRQTGIDGINLSYDDFEAGAFGTNECKPCAVILSKQIRFGSGNLKITGGEIGGFGLAGLSGIYSFDSLTFWAEGAYYYKSKQDSTKRKILAGAEYSFGKVKLYAEYFAQSDGSACKFCYDLRGKIGGRREYAGMYYVAGGGSLKLPMDIEADFRGIMNLSDYGVYSIVSAGKKFFGEKIYTGLLLINGFGNSFDEFYYYPAGFYLNIKYLADF